MKQDKLKDKKIFICHSPKDKRIGKYIIDMLVLMGISRENIFFSSEFYNGAPAGTDLFEQVKQAIQNCDLAIFLISSNLYDNKYCMNEMGAVWALNKSILPLIISDEIDGKEQTCFYDYRIVKIDWYNDITQNKLLLLKLNQTIGIEYNEKNLNIIDGTRIKILKYSPTLSLKQIQSLEYLSTTQKHKINKIIKKYTKEILLDENIEKRLNYIFSSKILFQALFDSCKENFCYNLVMIKLSAVLIYYLYTQDKNFSYNLIYEIMSCVGFGNIFPSKEIIYNGLKNVNPNANNKQLGEILASNSIHNGYAVHSFNPVFKEEIFKKGLGGKYEEKSYSQNLSDLEKIIYKNRFLTRQKDTSFYFTIPSANAMHYACVGSPERVFGGPLKFLSAETNFDSDICVNKMIPITVGEGIKKYYKKVGYNNIKIVANNNTIFKSLKHILNKKMKKLVDDFCCDYSNLLLIPFNDNGKIISTYNERKEETKEKMTIFDYIQTNGNETGVDYKHISTFEDAYNIIKSITPTKIGVSDSSKMGNLCSTDVITNFENVLCIKIPTYYYILQQYCKRRFFPGTKIITELSPYINNPLNCVKRYKNKKNKF